MSRPSDDLGPKLIPSQEALEELGNFYHDPDEEQHTEEVWDYLSIRRYWLQTWRDAINDDYDVTILIDGASGKGKSALALDIGVRLDPTLTAKTVMNHVAFTAAEFLNCIERSHKGQVVIFDEAVRGMLSSDTFASDQKAIVTALAIVRAKNLIMILLAPDLWLVAKSFRARRAGWWLHVEDRGVALVHVRSDTIRYEPDSSLGLFLDKQHSPFTWESLDGTHLWIAYFKEKMRRINSYLSDAKKEIERHGRKKRGSRDKDDDDQDEPSTNTFKKDGTPLEDDP